MALFTFTNEGKMEITFNIPPVPKIESVTLKLSRREFDILFSAFGQASGGETAQLFNKMYQAYREATGTSIPQPETRFTWVDALDTSKRVTPKLVYNSEVY